MKRLWFATVLFVVTNGCAEAQTIDLQNLLGDGRGSVSGRIVQLVTLLTVLSVAPGILVTLTCFIRFSIALSFLRTGLGLGTTPPNMILVSLALLMTIFVMGPTFDRMWTTGIEPLIENKLSEREAYVRITQPLREFMQANAREKDIRLFEDLLRKRGAAGLAGESHQLTAEPADLRVLVPAFMISELRRGFEIGFLILLPFLVIDLIVATILMSMGMMMLPPTTISLPFKVLFFVLIDGWHVLIGGLVRSVG
jgi:flagellar biosynthesis protein FliP